MAQHPLCTESCFKKYLPPPTFPDPVGVGFRVGAGISISIPDLVSMVSAEPICGISPNLHAYIIGASLGVD